jgi:anti-anti-sigma factor
MTKCGIRSCELVRPSPCTAVAVLTGEHDVSTLSLLRQMLVPLKRETGLLVVIDLSRATFIDAAVLTALGDAEQAVTGHGGRIGLLPGTAPIVWRVLELTGWLHRPCATAGDVGGPWELLAARAAC